MKKTRFLSMVLCIVLVASLFTGFVSTASADDVINYVVSDGDYLFKICNRMGLDYYQCKNAIMVLNGFTTEVQLNRLSVGQNLKMPATNAIAATVKASSTTTTTVTTSTTVGGVTTTTTSSSSLAGNLSGYNVAFYLLPHTVQYGETLASICNMYGTSYGQYSSMILGMNNIANANNVWAGKTIQIPSRNAPSSGVCYAVVNHVVSSGENLTSICSNYGLSYSANATLIKGLNSSKNLNTIYAGQNLYIPIITSAGNNGNNGNNGNPTQSGYSINLLYSSSEGLPHAEIDDRVVVRADEGKTVKIIGGAKSGYAFTSITVTRADNHANIERNGNSFKMPPCDVNVEINYVKGLKITRNVENLNCGTFETLVNDEAVEYACYGDLVTLKFYPKAGYSAQVVKLDGKELTQSADGTYSFKMPNAEVTVKVTFEATKLLPINSKFVDYYYVKNSNDFTHSLDKAGTLTYKVDDVECTKAAKNTQVRVKCVEQNNYKVKDVIVVKAGTNPNNTLNRITTTLKDGRWYFKMPDFAGGVDVYAVLEKTYSVKAKSVTGGSLKFSSSDTEFKEITRMEAGEKVYIVPSPSSGYTFTKGVDVITVTYAGGASFAPVDTTGNYVSFVMPANDVTVTPSWTKDTSEAAKQYTISKSDKDGEIKIYVRKALNNTFGSYVETNKAVGGDIVRVCLKPNSGKLLSAIEFSTGVEIKEGTTNNWTADTTIDSTEKAKYVFTADGYDCVEFKMPKKDLKVTAKFYDKVSGQTVRIAASDVWVKDDTIAPVMPITVTVNGEQTENATVGYKLVASFTVPDGYGIATDTNGKKLVYLVRNDGTVNPPMEVMSENSGKYSYTIKETDLGLTDIHVLVILTSSNPNTYYSVLKNNEEYSIKVEGAVTAQAREGQKVVVESASGKTIKNVRAFTGNVGSSSDLTVTNDGEGTYYFIMPADSVTTVVEFVEEKTLSVKVNGSEVKKVTGTVGDLITVVVDDIASAPSKVEINGSEALQSEFSWDSENKKLTIVYTFVDISNEINVTLS